VDLLVIEAGGSLLVQCPADTIGIAVRPIELGYAKANLPRRPHLTRRPHGVSDPHEVLAYHDPDVRLPSSKDTSYEGLSGDVHPAQDPDRERPMTRFQKAGPRAWSVISAESLRPWSGCASSHGSYVRTPLSNGSQGVPSRGDGSISLPAASARDKPTDPLRRLIADTGLVVNRLFEVCDLSPLHPLHLRF